MAHYQQYYNQNLHVLPIQFWYCTSLQWYNTRNTPNLNSFCWNAKMMSFSNLILTLFTCILCASAVYRHIFGLMLVAHGDLGVQLDHSNGFSIVWHSKSNFPAYWRAYAPKIVWTWHMRSHIIGFLLVALARVPMPIKIGTIFQNKLRPSDNIHTRCMYPDLGVS